MLPVISNILPLRIRREQSLICEWNKYVDNSKLPIHTDPRLFNEKLQLKSCKPTWLTANELIWKNVHQNIKWYQDWESDTQIHKIL